MVSATEQITVVQEDRYILLVNQKIVVANVICLELVIFFFFQAEDGIRDYKVTGVQTCALPISSPAKRGTVPASKPSPGVSPSSPHSKSSCSPTQMPRNGFFDAASTTASRAPLRSEEHTSELQSPCNLVCRLLLEKKNMKQLCV